MTLLSVVNAISHLSAFAPDQDFFWQNKIFEKNNWEGAMKFMRIALTMVTALLLMYEARAARLRERIPRRYKRNIAWVLTIVAFFTYFDFFNPNVRYSEYYHRHEFFHYYLGSKYFKEIGYNRLYECTAIAEIELGRRAQVASREIRDLHVNLIKEVKDTYILTDPGQCKNHFTAARWEDWKKDVDWFYHSSAGSYWDNMQKDHGYNPPPVWTMTGKLFGSFAPAGDKFFKILSGIDVLLHVGIVALFYWAFGWRVMLVATVFWGCNAPANFYWTGGAFLRQDWLFFLVAAVCCARKRKFFLSGAALTWSSLLRIFPVVFFGGWGIMVLYEIIRRVRFGTTGNEKTVNGVPAIKREPGLLGYLHPDHRRLIAGCVIAAGVLIPASVAVCGVDSYKQFFGHTIKVHNATPLTNHMGLETMLLTNWDGRMRFLRDDNMDDPFEGWKQSRIDRFKTIKPLFLLICAGAFAWTAWSLRRTKLLWIGLAVGSCLVISLTNLTCYYYSLFMVVPAMVAVRPALGPPIVVTSGISTILLYAPTGFYWVDDRFVAQAWLFYVLSLMVLWAYSRPFSVERLKAWWAGKPEPKSNALPPSSAASAAE
ncbi:MAG TPA: hypothetical protein VHV51_19235 [Polyangiaceae bacterium]|nr:hypothetical protein [Polyangiaceae bacterium]